jgi:hypothetical protein
LRRCSVTLHLRAQSAKAAIEAGAWTVSILVFFDHFGVVRFSVPQGPDFLNALIHKVLPFFDLILIQPMVDSVTAQKLNLYQFQCL